MCAMVLSMPGLPDTQLTVDVSSPSPSSPSIRTPRGPDSAGGGDGLLRWRCKEIGCGSAFLTREQLRIHMKTGQHGMGAPLPDSSGADRRTPRMSVPPRQGGYTLRGRSEDDDEMDEDHELPAAVDHQGHQIGAGPHPSNLSSSPTDAPLNPWDADHWHVRSRAQREADQIRRQAMHKAKQERDAEWAEQLEMAQAEVARKKEEDAAARIKRKAEEEAVRQAQDEQVQKEVIDKTMERLEKWKKQKTVATEVEG